MEKICYMVTNKNVDPVSAPMQLTLENLLQLKAMGFSPSFIQVHLAAIAAFHTHVNGKSIFFPCIHW